MRIGADGGMGHKPSDRWTISLCKFCHAEQHQIGETAFELKHAIDMKKLAEAFFLRSPHRHKLETE